MASDGTLTATVDQLQAEVDSIWRAVTALAFCTCAIAVVILIERWVSGNVG